MMKIKNDNIEIKKIIHKTVILAIIFCALSLLLEDPIPFIKGILFGAIFSILNFRILDLSFKRAVGLPPKKAQGFIVSRYMLRYILAGIVLYVSIQNSTINVLGTIVGLFLLKLVIQVSNILSHYQYKKRKVN